MKGEYNLYLVGSMFKVQSIGLGLPILNLELKTSL